MSNRITKLALPTLAILATGMATANAQNPTYAAGDLVLYFQNPGGSAGADQTLYVNLGNTALNFRGAAAGADAGNLLNIINIDSQLTAAFGANWASESTVYAGLAGVWGTSTTSSVLTNGDPHRTLYVSQARNELGTVGTPGSAGWTINNDTGMTQGASNMNAQNNVLETQGTGLTLQIGTGTSNIDDQNQFLAPGIQGTGFGVFAGGVQQGGSSSQLGDFGGLSGVEFALDLYRILARTNVAGQVGGTARSGSFEGTVVLDELGNVSFLTTPIPEPSSALLVGLLGLAGVAHRRRK